MKAARPRAKSAAKTAKQTAVGHWLFKSEPATFGVEHLAAAPKRTSAWDGVRNFQARNMLRDSIKKGDLAFFYHSSCALPGIAGIVRIVRGGYPDETAFDPGNDHHDPDSRREAPRWYAVDVQLVRRLRRVITLDELRRHASKELAELAILRRGNRLSVTPVTSSEWDFILRLE
jgi:predicted RNA-binding protein with PUA-like domain